MHLLKQKIDGKEITNQSIENRKLREMALSDNIIVSIERVNV